MKTISETKLFFLKEDCTAEFGMERGGEIFSLTENIYETMCLNGDYRNNVEIECHLTMNLFPTMAYYKALRESGFEKEEALVFVRKETTKAANIKKAAQANVARMPCAYLVYRLFVKKVMKKSFPVEGWDTKWICCNSNEIHFDMTRCIYKELCDSKACPELCTVFCENDDIAFSGLLPKIRFEREGTLGNGAEYCDFHFIKNK